MPRCKMCGFEGPVEDFKPSHGVYHDIYCPKCNTSAVDTTDVFEKWAKEGKTYGYGKNNVLVTK